MNLYNRQAELQELKRIYQSSKKKAHLVIVKGRRRVGKTTLVLESLQNKKYLYLFVAKKNPNCF